MLLKILKTFKLANPKVWLPHWEFTEGDAFATDDEYLIDRLLTLKAAKILKKTNEKEEKQFETPKNKMFTPEKVTKKRVRKVKKEKGE